MDMSEQRRRRRPIANMETGNEDEQQRENLAPNVPRHFDDYSATSSQDALLEYIKTAIEIETDIATQEQIISECQDDMSRRKPVLNLMDAPQSPEHIAVDESGVGALMAFTITAGLFALLAIYLFYQQFNTIEPYLLLVEGGLVALPVSLLIVVKQKNRQVRRNNAKQEKEYYRQRDIVERLNSELKVDYDVALHEWEESGSEVVGAIKPYLDETRALLARHYAKNLIYPKYQNLPALTSIYEYFITGRCEGLTGPYGAYNLYEDEIRKDTVISQLNRVVENLEQIRQNQYMLYTKVCTIQQEAAAIRNELAQIKGYTIRIADLAALSAYYARLTERNTRVMMYYHMF